MKTDYQGRRFQSLRLSLTAACNLACSYCVPTGMRLSATNREMSSDEMIKSVRLLCRQLGIQKVRLTGGEPLISAKLDRVLPELNQLGLDDISLTTNGQLLEKKAAFLKDNGINRINVSLDTLDEKKFRTLTRGGELQKTLAGIEAAIKVGLKIKVNMIPILNSNDDEVVRVLEYCLERGIELRYIELMRMGHLAKHEKFVEEFVSLNRLLEMIGAKYVVQEIGLNMGSTSRRYQVEGGGTFGVIANESAPFCGSCNRLRLTAEGDIYGCLSSSQKFPIRHLIDMPPEQAEDKLSTLLTAALATKQNVSFFGSTTQMMTVGG